MPAPDISLVQEVPYCWSITFMILLDVLEVGIQSGAADGAKHDQHCFKHLVTFLPKMEGRRTSKLHVPQFPTSANLHA